MYAQARAHDLPLSALTQQAVGAALDARRTEAWIERARARGPRLAGEVDTTALMAEVRADFGQ